MAVEEVLGVLVDDVAEEHMLETMLPAVDHVLHYALSRRRVQHFQIYSTFEAVYFKRHASKGSIAGSYDSLTIWREAQVSLDEVARGMDGMRAQHARALSSRSRRRL